MTKPKSAVVKVRLRDDELATYQEIAELTGHPLAEVIRVLAAAGLAFGEAAAEEAVAAEVDVEGMTRN